MVDQTDTPPRVSAVMPMYNAAPVIERALASALAQSYPCHEIIVVDDCSNDDSVEIVSDWQGRHPEIVLLRQQHNSGPAAARNRAIARASGEWLSILDCDDAWKPGRNRALLDLAGRTGADLLFDNVSLYDIQAGVEVRPGFAKTFREIVFDEAHFWENCVFGAFTYSTLKCFVRREFLAANRLVYPNMRYGEDIVFYGEMMRHGAVAALTSDDFYVYSTRMGEVSRSANTASLSVPAFDKIADGVDALRKRSGGALPPATDAAMARSARSFRAGHAMNLARQDKRAGRYLPMLAKLADPEAIALMARLRRRRAAVAGFTFEPLY